jgi:ORF6C domain-containing protein
VAQSRRTRATAGGSHGRGQAWSQERAARERVSIGVALRGCWSTLRTRYKVSRYEDIERQYFDDCVTYIQRQYQNLTGTELKLPEQGELDL